MAPTHPPSALHRVNRIRFEIAGDGEAVLLALRGRLAAAATHDVPEALNTVFNAAAGREEVLEIARLDVDLGELGQGKLDIDAFASATERALARIAAKAPFQARQFQAAGSKPDLDVKDTDDPLPRRRPIEEIATETLITYLLSGGFGAHSLFADFADLFEAIGLNKATVRRIWSAILNAPPAARRSALTRLIIAAPVADLIAILQSVHFGEGGKIVKKAGIKAEIERATRSEADLANFVDRLLLVLEEDSDATDLFIQESHGEAFGSNTVPLTQTVANADETDPIVQESYGEALRANTAAPTQADANEAEGTAAPNAGIVLLHPFLPRLFDRCGLTAKKRFRDDAAQATAARLVHYLATGEDRAEEPILLMPRLLCGVRAEVPVLSIDDLNLTHIAEADALLIAAIGHWAKLGKTSSSALRETFLVRPGVLKRTPDRQRLLVERRGVDTLLRSLPWTLDPVRLPWLQAPIAVDWV